jgi:hypothetical protein
MDQLVQKQKAVITATTVEPKVKFRFSFFVGTFFIFSFMVVVELIGINQYFVCLCLCIASLFFNNAKSFNQQIRFYQFDI